MLSLRRARTLGVAGITALGLGAVGSLVTASTGLAATPAGTACQLDGKISGRGSTLQGNAISALVTGYTNDVCGTVGNSAVGTNPNLNTYPTSTGTSPINGGIDPAGSNMVVYNWTQSGAATGANVSPTNAGARGSGEGLAAMACRTDAFGGTDIPYDDTDTTAPADGVLPWLWGQLPSASNQWPYFDPAYGADGANGCDTFYNKNGTTKTYWEPPYGPAPTSGCVTTTLSQGTGDCYPSGTVTTAR